ncbi:sensor histidine kinase [Konateibacter massiliensis]|uniref:sensor histidine kinase n=1 Tax=Konateibacter massiliensis TaxID=2002841 RepID=UPI000C14A82D|nr:sensor histidine kinase [Konateibacter massiliensis]
MDALRNTPGWNYAIAYCLAVLMYIQLNPKRMPLYKRLGVQALFCTAIITFMVFTDGLPVYLFVPCMLCSILLMYLFIYVCCDVSAMKTGYILARAFILGEFAASLEWQLYYYSVSSLYLPGRVIYRIIFMLFLHAIVFGLMYFLEKKYEKRAENNILQVKYRDVLCVVSISVAVFAISNLSYVFGAGPFSSQFTSEIFIIRTLVDAGGLILLFTYHLLLQESQLKMHMDALENMLHMQYNNYQISQESIAMVNQKYHDLKHQIALLRTEIASTEKLEYLDQMERDIKAYEAQNKTGNKVLDTVLTGKSLLCQRKGISLTCVADGEALDFMHAMDISSLFGNALDNAIESVKKIQDKEKRLIHVSVSRQKDFLRIKVENCYEGDIVFENGLPATTKKEKQFHGYGLKSIQNTAKKYHGSVKIHLDKGWFELRILIPLNEIEQ